MAGWQAGLLVLVQRVLQHTHVVLPANTAASICRQVLQSNDLVMTMHTSAVALQLPWLPTFDVI